MLVLINNELCTHDYYTYYIIIRQQSVSYISIKQNIKEYTYNKYKRIRICYQKEERKKKGYNLVVEYNRYDNNINPSTGAVNIKHKENIISSAAVAGSGHYAYSTL